MGEKRFLTVKELCQTFGLSPSSVYLRVASGQLPCLKIPCRGKQQTIGEVKNQKAFENDPLLGRYQIRFDYDDMVKFFKENGNKAISSPSAPPAEQSAE